MQGLAFFFGAILYFIILLLLLVNEMGQNHITVTYHNTSITTGKITTDKLVEEIRMSWRIMPTGCDR